MDFSIGGKEFDFYDDIDGSYAQEHMAKLGSVQVTAPDELLTREDDDFALKIITKLGHEVRKYPVITPGDTVVSALYFEKNAGKFPDELNTVAATFLKKAAAKHGLPCPKFIEDLAGDFESNEIKEASLKVPFKEIAEPRFALTTASGENFYPINNEEEVKVAMEYFEDNALLLEPVYRNKVATALMTEAETYGLNVSSESPVNSYATGDYSPLIGSQIAARRECLQHDGESLQIFDSLVEKQASLKSEEFAEVLENFDRISGLESHWGSHIDDPYKSTFQRVKVASKEVVHNGKSITETDLINLAESEKIASRFDKHFVNDLKGDPMAVFSSLPNPEKDLIASLVNEGE